MSDELKKELLDKLKACKSGMDTLQKDRAQLLKEYMGEPYGNEVKGRSQVVMSDISDKIEWIMPTLMRIFYGGNDVVDMRPQGPEDEMKVDLMKEKVNFDFQKCNSGYLILSTWFKDALLSRLGVVKYWWETERKYRKRSYEGLTEMDFMALESDDKFIIDEKEEIETEIRGEFGELIGIDKVYNVKGREIEELSYPKAENVPPEEFIFDIATKNTSELDFCAHKKKIHKKEAARYGLSKEDITAEIEKFRDDSGIVEARFKELGGINFLTPKEDDDYIYLYECFYTDYDEDGFRVSRKAVIIGDNVVEDEENSYGKPPFAVLSPVLVPHRMLGRAIADLMSSVQKLHTAMVRYILDNIYYQNSGVKVVNPYRINLDDLKNNNVPSGIIRTNHDIDPSTAIFPVPVSPFNGVALKALEYVNQIGENRTGVTKYNQGSDSKSLNKTATGISQIMNAAQQRVELIARTFAETGVRDLFQAFVDMNIDFFDMAQNIKINDTWQTVRPDDISGRFDVMIDVGIGTGNNEVKFQQLDMMLNKVAMALKGNVMVARPEHIHNTMTKMYELLGFKNAEGKYLVTKEEIMGNQGMPSNLPPDGTLPEGMDVPMSPAHKAATGGFLSPEQ